MTERQNDLLDAAIEYARIGWAVFPLKPMDKVPITAHGFQDASTNEKQIRAWWRKTPKANIGAPTGERFIAIDIDDYKGGFDYTLLREWALPYTLTNLTPHGGKHLLFTVDAPLPSIAEGGLGPQICIKAAGGYIVLPPSLLPDGPYHWDDWAQPLHRLPERMRNKIAAYHKPTAIKPSSKQRKAILGGDEGEKWFQDAMARTGQGVGDDIGFWLAQQCLSANSNGSSIDVHAVLTRYAWDATIGQNDPFSDTDVARWIRSAGKSEIVTHGHKARKQEHLYKPPELLERAAEDPPSMASDEGLIEDSQEEPEEVSAPPDMLTAMAGGGKAKLPLTKMCADHIEARGMRFALDSDDGPIYVYTSGVYVEHGETVIREMVKAYLIDHGYPEKWTRRIGEEVCGWIRIGLPKLWKRPPMDTLNLANGLLDIKTRALRDHSPEWLSVTQLPVFYEPKALCSAWDWLAETILPADAHMLAFELAAWLMVPMTRLQKAVMLTGEGGNGKSRLLNGLRAFIGEVNISTVSLQDIDAARFGLIRLYGKLANIYTDLSSVDLVGTGKFKTLTGGDERIMADRKFREPIEFVPYARMVFSTNTPPKSPDSSQAFYDRWLVIPFPNDFRGSAEEVNGDEVDAWLSQPEQLSGLLNLALDALQHLLGHGFSQGLSTQDAKAAFQEVTDPFAIWAKLSLTWDGVSNVPCDAMAKAYALQCAKTGERALSGNTLTRALHRLYPNIDRREKMENGVSTMRYFGVRLTEDQPPVIDPTPRRLPYIDN